MDVQLLAQPAATAALVTLQSGQTLVAESGALIAMTPHLRVRTTSHTRKGGVLSGLRRMLSKENFFLNHFTATDDAQHLIIGPSLAGDIVHHTLQGETLVVQGDGWLASDENIRIDTTWKGLTSALFSGEGLFWVACSGHGSVLLNSFGAIYTIDVRGSHVVDTGHIVAFEDTLSFDISKASHSLIGSFLGGEGFVCTFKGHGKVYCQTHNPSAFGRVLGPKVRPRKA
jgi:uncharacterized protein (TIGR00266 family)